VPDPVRKWQYEVHIPGIYDLEVDTSELSPKVCADVIRQYLENGIKIPTAFQQLAAQPLC
jgi:chloramphenicol 3-O phosphotransferase